MVEITMLIPTRGNDGKAFPRAHHRAFEERALELFGGFTRYPSEAVGAWVDQGRTYHDRTRIYGFAIQSIGEGGKVTDLAEFAKTHYSQEAIFVRYLGTVEIL